RTPSRMSRVDSSWAKTTVVGSPTGDWVGCSTRQARCESEPPTAAIRWPRSSARSQKPIAVTVNGFGPGRAGPLMSAGPVAISIPSTSP
ncbi:MAG TPA: hypothetical protein VK387_09185, partial [Thermoleophilaceae bacterium]|nr:hypothetical protein [Thermoleophilaceae bacterium]